MVGEVVKAAQNQSQCSPLNNSWPVGLLCPLPIVVAGGEYVRPVLRCRDDIGGQTR
jgi:hypothetical protein